MKMNIEEILLKAELASRIIKTIKEAPMTAHDKQQTHRMLMDALATADVDACRRALEIGDYQHGIR